MKNQSPKASEKLLARAKKLGLKAKIIENSKGHYRKDHPLGSTSVPQKVIEIEGKSGEKFTKTPRTGTEGCCGKGCNGCLPFWHDEKYAKAREILKNKKIGEML